MSELHERVAAIPADIPQAELFALGAARGPLTAELPRTFSGAAARQWTMVDDPPLVLEVLEYHMFDVRLWRVRGAVLAAVELTLAALPRVDPDERARWLTGDDPHAFMRALRTAAVLGDPWTPALEQHLERALTDPRAAIRWAAFRAISLGRWPAAPLLRRIIPGNKDRHPAIDLLAQLADAIEVTAAGSKNSTPKSTATKAPATKSPTRKPAAKKSPASKRSTASKGAGKQPAAKKPAKRGKR